MLKLAGLVRLNAEPGARVTLPIRFPFLPIFLITRLLVVEVPSPIPPDGNTSEPATEIFAPFGVAIEVGVGVGVADAVAVAIEVGVGVGVEVMPGVGVA